MIHNTQYTIHITKNLAQKCGMLLKWSLEGNHTGWADCQISPVLPSTQSHSTPLFMIENCHIAPVLHPTQSHIFSQFLLKNCHIALVFPSTQSHIFPLFVLGNCQIALFLPTTKFHISHLFVFKKKPGCPHTLSYFPFVCVRKFPSFLHTQSHISPLFVLKNIILPQML